ncbi:MAG: response regulator transcription factor [Cyclobacteriaceae bacterium]
MIDILMAVKQPLIVAGLNQFLAAEKDLAVNSVETQLDLHDSLRNSHPDILILDPDFSASFNIDDLEEINNDFPVVKTLILSSLQSKSIAQEILRLKVNGFVTKDCDQRELLLAIKTLSRGDKYFCQEVLALMIESSFAPSVKQENSTLTPREEELLKLIARGFSNQKAADTMNVSPHTVHTHRKKISRKLNIKSPTEFLIRAIDLGLVELPIRK